MTINAAHAWNTNAELINDVHRLGYIDSSDLVLDGTFGKGTWWKVWHPDTLVAHDKKIDGTDFRDLPYPDKTFDVAAYDPPYVSVGGRKTTTIPEMHAAYGMDDAPTSPMEVQRLIDEGLTEMNRLTKRFVLVKCQDYISSGKFFPGTIYTMAHAVGVLDMEIVDRFIMITTPRPQPPRDRQVHARNNCSTLFVLKPSDV